MTSTSQNVVGSSLQMPPAAVVASAQLLLSDLGNLKSAPDKSRLASISAALTT
jgi:hypothetical protein